MAKSEARVYQIPQAVTIDNAIVPRGTFEVIQLDSERGQEAPFVALLCSEHVGLQLAAGIIAALHRSRSASMVELSAKLTEYVNAAHAQHRGRG